MFKKGKSHPYAKYPRVEKEIIRLIVKNPELGSRQIAKRLSEKISHVQVNSLLKKLGAETYDRRINFARNYSGPGRLKNDVAHEVVNKCLAGFNISKLSKEYLVSRDTIYRWLKKYNEGAKLNSNYVVGVNHPKALYPKFEQQVLDLVTKNPNLTPVKIAKNLPISSYTIWKIFDQNNLNSIAQRNLFSVNRQEIPEEISAPDFTFNEIKSNNFFQTPNTLPGPPPKENVFFNFWKTLVFTSLVTLPVGLGFLNYQQNYITGIGTFFATVALLFGGVFFLYSLKYYLTLLFVLSYSPKDKKLTPRNSIEKFFFKLTKNSYNSTGIVPDLGEVILEKKPFVSVHISLFNEKNVVERIVKATTSFDYPEYEVVLADDSTDETVNIIRDFQEKCLFKGEKLKVETYGGYTVTSVEVRPNVYLKHVHRQKRDGFKGAALSVALNHVNPKTEYISVFDADFVPYPDSLNLFLKYFQESHDEKVAVVQGYQWHVLNKSENWITRGVRSEYSGSYVVERSGAEIYGGLKQISGSVYMIKKDVLSSIGWGRSITEDFELTLRLYEKGYKVLYTPYVQAPAECVSTLTRLIRQRMRWAEGHSFNIKKMFSRLINSPSLTMPEKVELIYLAPYYLQAFFFLIGTFAWLLAETVFRVRLPFWTEVWGWSLIITNMVALPLVNGVGLFLEESEHKDYSGLGSFIMLSYIVVPFQAYAAVKGFIEKEEGPWFRTPKTGRITDIFRRSGLARFVQEFMPTTASPYLSLATANNKFNNFDIKRSSSRRWLGKAFLSIMLAISVTLTSFAPTIQNLSPKNANAFGFTNNDKSNIKTVDTIPDDFLAINTDKTIYKSDETVKISLADIDYLGETVCDAKIHLIIKSPNGTISEMDSEEKSIKINKELCENKTILSITPDYESRFQTAEEGKYEVLMTANRYGETYKTSTYFVVDNKSNFDIKRISATRIYPKNIYPMIIKIRTNIDYKGTVSEDAPANFDIYDANENDLNRFLDTKKGNKINTGITDGLKRSKLGDRQTIIWNVDWKKGNEYILSYFYDTPDKSPDLYSLSGLIIDKNNYSGWNLAIDASGSGTNTVSPTSATAGSVDQTFTFTYDPSETFTTGGEIRIKVPNSSGWSAPQGTGGTAGYTTASVTGTGTIADLLVTGDSATEGNWTLTEDDTDACNAAGTNPSIDTTTKVEGSGSVKCDNTGSTGPDPTDSFSFDNSGTVDWSSYTTIGFWMRSSKALTSTNGITFSYDDTAAMSSLLQSFDTGTVSANTWTYFTFTLTATRTAVKAFGLVATGTGFDSAIQYLDEVTIGPGSPSFVANGGDTDIRVRFITLDTAATVTVTYGSGGGTSGVDTPSTPGSYEFTTRSRVATSSTYDSLTGISSHPTVTLTGSNFTAYSFQRKTWYDGTRYWRSYNDSVNSRINFEYSSDGTSWTEDTSARISTNTNDFSVWGDSTSAFITYTNGYDVETRKASSYPGTGFSWGSATVVYNGSSVTDKYSYPTIAQDTNGKIWISTTAYQSGTITDQQIATASDDGSDVAGDGTFHSVGHPDETTPWSGGDCASCLATAGTNASGNAITTGFRFTGIGIPKGALITSATIDLKNEFSAVQYGTNVKSTINGGLTANVSTFSNSNLPRSITKTSSSTSWNSVAETIATGTWFSSTLNNQIPSITNIVQEIVNQSNWVSGNALSILISNNGSSTDWWWEPYSYESAQASSAKLNITYAGYRTLAIQSSSANDITSWGTESVLNSSTNSNQYGVIVPRGSGSMMSIWMDGTGIESDTYSGSWSGSPTSVATGVSGLTTTISATVDTSGNVHLLYIDSSNHTVYKEYTSSWQTSVTLDSNSGNEYPSISLNSSNNDVYAFWVRGGHIYYKKGVSGYTSGSWDAGATDWKTTGTNTWVSSVYSYLGPSFAVWTTDSGTPPINWDIIAVPELMWLFFGVGPLIPLLSKLRKKKHGTEKNI